MAPPDTMLGGASTVRYSHGLRKLAQPSIVLLVSILLVIVGSILALLSWSEVLPFGAGAGLAVAVIGAMYLLYGCLFVFPSLVVRLDRIKEEASRDLHWIKEESEPEGSRTSYLTEIRERLALENNVRTTLVQAVLGVGVLLGAAFTWQQFIKTSQDLSVAHDQLDLDRTTKVSEQFTTATELLSNPELEARLGGLYTLQRLTRTAKGSDEQVLQDSLIAYQLLAAYIKARSPWPPPTKLDEDQRRRGINRYDPLEIESLRKRSPDVQIALDIVGARDKKLPKGEDYHPFLTDTDLRGAVVSNLDLRHAELRGAMLDYANGRVDASKLEKNIEKLPDFSEASLQGASLRCAHLEGSSFANARLDNTDLRDADLRRFPGTAQRDAILRGAVLNGAIWNEGTEWPDDVDPHKDEQLRSRLIKDEQSLARPEGSQDILLILGGTRVVKPRIAIINGLRVPLEEPTVQGGNIIARLHGGKWLKLAEPVALQRRIPLLTCTDYQRIKYWPGSPNIKCPRHLRRSCPPKIEGMKEDNALADILVIARRSPALRAI